MKRLIQNGIIILMLLFALGSVGKSQVPTDPLMNGDEYFSKAELLLAKDSKDSALYYFQEAIYRFESIDDWSSLVLTNNKIGEIYRLKKDYGQSIIFFSSAISVAMKTDDLNNNENLAMSYHARGRVFYAVEDYKKALDDFLAALEIRVEVLGEGHLDTGKTLHNIAKAHEQLGNTGKDLEYSLRALENKILNHGENHNRVYHSLASIASSYFYNGDFELGIEYGERAVNVMRNLLEKDSSKYNETFYAASLCNLALNYINMRDLDQGEQLLRESYPHWLVSLKVSDVYIYYSNMGRCYLRAGDYKRSRFYYNKAFEIFDSMENPPYNSLAFYYTSVGNIYYTGERNFDEAIKYFNKTINIREKYLPNNHIQIGFNNNNVGLCFMKLGKYQEALNSFKKAKKSYSAVSFNSGSLNSNIAEVYIKLGKYQEAEKLLLTSLELERKRSFDNKYNVVRRNQQLALCYYEWGKWEEAYENINKGLSIIDSKKSLNMNDLTMDLLNLRGLINLSKSKKNGQSNIELLNLALDDFQYAINLISKERVTYKARESKELLLEKGYIHFERAIETAYQLFKLTNDNQYLGKAFEFAEQSKSALFLEAIQDSKAKIFGNVPKEWVEKEKKIDNEIITLQGLLNSESQKSENQDTLKIAKLTTEIEDRKIQLFNFISDTEVKYPKYYQLKFSNETVKLKEVQDNLLKEKETLLEYFIGEESIFIFVVNKEDLQLIKVRNDFQLNHLVDDFIISLTTKRTISSETYITSAYDLYLKLVGPAQPFLNQNLYVIPDGVLGRIPFDALIMNLPKVNTHFKTHDYLLNKYSISYQFSATLFSNSHTNYSSGRYLKTSLAMAPFTREDTIIVSNYEHNEEIERMEWSPLDSSGVEVIGINSFTNGDVYSGKDATEELFKRSSHNYQVLHLATHGKAKSKKNEVAYIAFASQNDSTINNLLYAHEIYSLDLNAEMTVLSACETGTGQIQKGEGIKSLARAFSYAGSKSVITSLWRVNDAKTKDLMIQFYSNLNNELPKNEALQQTKISYLNNNKHSKAHPYYWASFIPIGNMSPLQFHSK